MKKLFAFIIKPMFALSTFIHTVIKIICFIILFSVGSHDASAQLAEGFYHFKNSVTGRYISINDTNPENYAVSQTGDVNMGGIRTYINYDSVSVSPSCVFFVRDLGNGNYDLETQGSSLCAMLNQKSTLKIISNDNGTYKLCLIINGIYKELSDGSESTSDSWMMNRLDYTRNWYAIPINTTDEYIAVRPDIKTIDGTFWGTIYAGFNFRLASEGLIAYYISHVGEAGFTMNRIEKDVIPSGTPVIIKCNSANSLDNKIEPVVGDYSFEYPNCMEGVYCSLNVAKHRNMTLYDNNTMRLLSLNDKGELAFVKSVPTERLYNDQYLMANKSYLRVNSGESEVIQVSIYEQKCATPTITIENDHLKFNCATDDVEFHYTITTPESYSSIGNNVQFPLTYTVSVFATKEGYEVSEVATKDIELNIGKRGDLNNDGNVTVTDVVTLVDMIMSE